MSDQTLYSTQGAGDWLAEAIPGKDSKYWQGVLIANRRNDRPQVHKIPFATVGRGAFYTQEALQEFAEFEKVRRLGKMRLSPRATEALRAFGIGESGGSSTGRKLTVTGINSQIDQATGLAFVQLITSDPLMVYRLEPDQAVAVGKELLEAGQQAQRINSQNQPTATDVTGYEVISDNADVKIMRKVPQ